MRRSRSYSRTPSDPHEDELHVYIPPASSPVDMIIGGRDQQLYDMNGETAVSAALVHNIASFLTLSDAHSLVAPVGNDLSDNSPVSSPTDSWAVGEELYGSVATPPTPALVVLSPGATPHYNGYMSSEDHYESPVIENAGILLGINHEDARPDSSAEMERLLRERRMRLAQEKISSAVFSQPRSLRTYCLEAYTKAKDIQEQKDQENQENLLQVRGSHASQAKQASLVRLPKELIQNVANWIFQGVPVSTFLVLADATGNTCIDTAGASFTITATTLHQGASTFGHVVSHCVTNPFQVLEAIISLQFNAMGRTSEVLVSGIQSVATGVGSASSIALSRLSTANMNSSVSLAGHMMNHSGSTSGERANQVWNEKLLKKLSVVNEAALVVHYQERRENSGMTRHAVTRARRMLHYSVSLGLFVATVTVPTASTSSPTVEADDVSYENPQDNGSAGNAKSFVEDKSMDDACNSSQGSFEDDDSPFMCTPQSFPPTPKSRQMAIAQRSRLSDDVVFLARDRLRVHDGTKSENERTRERAHDLETGKRLAIFACDPESGIELTCGRHIATKVGNGVYYSSARSMVPVLRNCFVYFEMTILPRPGIPLTDAVATTLSVGLSTAEMPPNTLVGAWTSSVGICTTGQLLLAGQWCSPADPAQYAYTVGATVGCLVCLDDESAFETWDGVMLRATVRFTVNGVMVSPPVSTLPMVGAPASLPNSAATLPISGTVANSLSSIDSERLSPAFQAVDPPSGQMLPSTSTLSLIVPSAEDLYPTVTLQSAATSVVCRFSSEDIMAKSRNLMGAPLGSAVFGVDGSVILNENEDILVNG